MNCTECKEKWVEYTEGLLPESQKQIIEEHLKNCQQCRADSQELNQLQERITANSNRWQQRNLEDAVFNQIIRRQNENLKPADRINRQLKIWRKIMKSNITKFAAAIIIIAALTTIYRLTGSIDGASVALADVIKNMDQVQTFTCRVKIDSKGMELFGTPSKPITSTLYNSSTYGRRTDFYIDKKVFLRRFCLPETNEIIGIMPEAKLYAHHIIPDDVFDPTITQDPHSFITEFLSSEYTKLGRKKINGKIVEGFEITDPLFCLNMFEKLTVRLWVDVTTNLPVLFEQDFSADAGKIRQTTVCDRFEWNIPLEPDLFKPDIPDDYVLRADTIVDNKSETMAIEGLCNFARYTDGQYPSSMFLAIAKKEIILAWQASINWTERQPTEQEWQQISSIHSTCLFYANLDKQDKDPAYYGNNVTANDTDAVLMRWKVSDDEYRVIFGDLTAGNVSGEELAALENDPAFQDILLRPRQGIKAKGIIGINLDNWPAITVMPDMPAEKTGFKNGDVVIGVNGQDVSHITTIPDALKVLTGPVGETLSLTVERNGQILDFDVERVPL